MVKSYRQSYTSPYRNDLFHKKIIFSVLWNFIVTSVIYVQASFVVAFAYLSFVSSNNSQARTRAISTIL